MRVTLLDLGVGNLHSLGKAIVCVLPGADVVIEPDPARAAGAELLVLPGVGAFPAAAERVAPHRAAIRDALERGLACVGICLGMQLLFERSEEGPGEGLGVFSGGVTRLATPRTPHMGWSPVAPVSGAPAWPWPSAVYYAHSFACRAADLSAVVATTTLDGDTFPAVVRRGRILGFQFHPEKSSAQGLELLGAALREVTS